MLTLYVTETTMVAYAAGVKARLDGLPLASNPHRPGSRAAAGWALGWADAGPPPYRGYN